MWRDVLAIATREVLLAIRSIHESLNPLLFLLIVVVLFALGVTPQPQLLHEIAPGVIWVAALLALFLTVDRLFRPDLLDGSLEQWLLLPQSLPQLVLIKVLMQVLLLLLPLLLLTPLLGVLFSLSTHEIAYLCLSLMVSLPGLMFLAAIGAALVVSVNHSGVLLALLVLPLSIPILIFGTGVVHSAPDQALGLLALLFAISVMLMMCAPFAISTALRLALSVA